MTRRIDSLPTARNGRQFSNIEQGSSCFRTVAYPNVWYVELTGQYPADLTVIPSFEMLGIRRKLINKKIKWEKTRYTLERRTAIVSQNGIT